MPDTHTPAVAITAAQSYIAALALDLITPSKTNPRKRFDPAALDELAQSIKVKGVAQPVLVRPMPDKTPGYELVVGERRLRACKLAALPHIPAIVQDLSDIDVIEIQIIENLQRADVHPIEEAEGYDKLMQQTNCNADDIAHKVGKSRRYVYNRLKLLDLCPEGRNAFFDDKIDITKARLIARIGHHDTQRQALKQIITPNHEGAEPISTREAERLIEREFMTGLASAPFDIKMIEYKDPKGKIIAGPCGTCPKRSGNSPELFDDITNKDICTDVKCFHAKRSAHLAIEETAFVAKGMTVVTGKEAKAILPNQWSNNPAFDGKWVGADQICHDDEKKREFGKIIGKAMLPVVVRRDDDNEFVKVYPKADVEKLLREKGIEAPKPSKATAKNHALQTGDAAPAEWLIRLRAYLILREGFAGGLPETEFRLMIDSLLTSLEQVGSDCHVLLPIYAPELMDSDVDYSECFAAIRVAINALPAEQLPRALLDCVVDDMTEHNMNMAAIDDLMKRQNLTKKAVLKQMDADAKAKAAAEAAAKEPTPPVTPESEVATKPAKAAKAKK